MGAGRPVKGGGVMPNTPPVSPMGSTFRSTAQTLWAAAVLALAIALSSLLALTSDANAATGLKVSQTSSPKTGGVVTLRITVTNSRKSAVSVAITESIAGHGITKVSHTSSIATKCSAVPPARGYKLGRRCRIKTLEAGKSSVLTFAVTAPADAKVAGYAVARTVRETTAVPAIAVGSTAPSTGGGSSGYWSGYWTYSPIAGWNWTWVWATYDAGWTVS
jgi:hypothetical protein